MQFLKGVFRWPQQEEVAYRKVPPPRTCVYCHVGKERLPTEREGDLKERKERHNRGRNDVKEEGAT